MDNPFNEFLERLAKTKVPENFSRYCVYFVECEGVFKIGTTSDIKSRLNTLQTSSPNPMKLAYTIAIPYKYDHGEVEKALHTIFAENYIRGEWYKITHQDIERIKLLSINDIINIAEKMKGFRKKGVPQKPKNQMGLFDEEND